MSRNPTFLDLEIGMARVSLADMYCDVVEKPADFDQVVGSQVRRLRQANQLTQEGLARSLGVARTSVTNIEAGRQTLSAWLLFQIANLLKVDVGELLPDAKHVSWLASESLPGDLTPKSREFISLLASNG
jgi:DNA-binding XRE family transcriptional regulator